MNPSTPSTGAPVFTDPSGTNAPAATGPAFGSFPLGRLLATPGALTLLAEFGISPIMLLMRHGSGDWGELDDHDSQVNELAVAHGERILSAYLLRRVEQGRAVETCLWVITEADRTHTVILLPSEY